MYKLILILMILVPLAACGAGTEKPAAADVQSLPAAETQPTRATETAPEPETETPAAPKPKTEPQHLVRFLEIGSVNCIPCRMMQPIMKEIEEEYQGLVKVEFYDLYVDREIGLKYGIRVMPTQVFLDHEGREFFRHEGFYPKAEIETMLAEKIGLTKPAPN